MNKKPELIGILYSSAATSLVGTFLSGLKYAATRSAILYAQLTKAPCITEEVYRSADRLAEKFSSPYFDGTMALGGLSALLLACAIYYTMREE